MKELKIETSILVCSYNELSDADKILVDKAKEMTTHSYAPYSKFHVGAAARLANGMVVTGSNQENAAYPSGLCAERTTLFYANSQYPHETVEALAVAACTQSGFINRPIPPCGACRQVILETETRFKQPVRILLYGEKETYIIKGIKELLPLTFDGSDLEK